MIREFSYILPGIISGGKIKLSGHREILSSNIEESSNRTNAISLVPMYGDYGKSLKGVQLLKHTSYHREKIVIFNLFDSVYCTSM
jgi:hypothetical protein